MKEIHEEYWELPWKAAKEESVYLSRYENAGFYGDWELTWKVPIVKGESPGTRRKRIHDYMNECPPDEKRIIPRAREPRKLNVGGTK